MDQSKGVKMSRMLSLFACLIAAAAPLSAEEAIQTDWSGGAGVSGPVNDWGSTFEMTSGISWCSIPGQLALSATPLATPIAHQVETSTACCSLFGCDLDGDGDVDVLGAELHGDALHWWRNDGDGWSRFTILDRWSGPRSVRGADIDADGRMDVVATGFANEVIWLRNEGGDPMGWTEFTIGTGFDGGHEIWTPDMDGDGDVDVIGAGYLTTGIRWWRNDGGDPIAWVEQELSDTFGDAVSVFPADFDGDGDVDAAGASYNGDRITWWCNRGGDPITWTEHDVDASFNGAHMVSATDIDLDGDIDLVAGAYHACDVVWYRNDGGDPISWARIPIDENFSGVASVSARDIDGDGDGDVLAGGQDPGDLAWWENTHGSGNRWELHWIDDSYLGAWPIHLVDMDRDGDLDALGGAYYMGHIRWWELTEFASTGELTGSILDLGAAPSSASLDWDAIQPASTALAFQVRSSADPENLGEWSGDMTTPGGIEIPVDRYIQYRVRFESTLPAASPVLNDLALASSSGSAVPEGLQGGIGLLVPSPVRGALEIRWDRSASGPIEVALYDAAGRRLMTRESAASGPLVLSAPAPGVYFCRARLGGAEAARRVVVID